MCGLDETLAYEVTRFMYACKSSTVSAARLFRTMSAPSCSTISAPSIARSWACERLARNIAGVTVGLSTHAFHVLAAGHADATPGHSHCDWPHYAIGDTPLATTTPHPGDMRAESACANASAPLAWLTCSEAPPSQSNYSSGLQQFYRGGLHEIESVTQIGKCILGTALSALRY